MPTEEEVAKILVDMMVQYDFLLHSIEQKRLDYAHHANQFYLLTQTLKEIVPDIKWFEIERTQLNVAKNIYPEAPSEYLMDSLIRRINSLYYGYGFDELTIMTRGFSVNERVYAFEKFGPDSIDWSEQKVLNSTDVNNSGGSPARVTPPFNFKRSAAMVQFGLESANWSDEKIDRKLDPFWARGIRRGVGCLGCSGISFIPLLALLAIFIVTKY